MRVNRKRGCTTCPSRRAQRMLPATSPWRTPTGSQDARRGKRSGPRTDTLCRRGQYCNSFEFDARRVPLAGRGITHLVVTGGNHYRSELVLSLVGKAHRHLLRDVSRRVQEGSEEVLLNACRYFKLPCVIGFGHRLRSLTIIAGISPGVTDRDGHAAHGFTRIQQNTGERLCHPHIVWMRIAPTERPHQRQGQQSRIEYHTGIIVFRERETNRSPGLTHADMGI